MASLIDIGRSGLLAHRTALAVTSENIANVGTLGFRRRDVAMTQIAGAQGSIATAATMGQGVLVDQVRRAFDMLTANRLRAATGVAQAAAAHEVAARGIEQLMMPGTHGLNAAIGDFFASVASLAAAPADSAAREVVLGRGRAMAGTIAGAARGIERLQSEHLAEAQAEAGALNAELRALTDVQGRIIATSGAPGGAANGLLDERDRLVASIAGRLGATATLDDIGRVRLTLGEGTGGPVLLENLSAATVSVDMGPGGPVLSLTREGTTRAVRMPDAGAIAGHARGIGAAGAALAELDALARRIAGDLNAVHRRGTDLNGQPGGDLFRLDGVGFAPGAGNRGDAQASLAAMSGALQGGPYTLVRDEAAGLWRAEDAQGATVATGTDRIDLPGGVTVQLSGTAADGDRIGVTATAGRARDMALVPQDAMSLAAAAALVVAPAPGNTGLATLSAHPAAPVPLAPGLSPLAALLSGTAGTAAGAVSLLGAGVAGIIPAGTRSLSLAALGQPAVADLSLPAGALAQGGTLRLSVGGADHAFSLPVPSDPAALATALADGSLRSDSGARLSDLGVAAAATPAGLVLTRAGGDFDSPPRIDGAGPGLPATAFVTPHAAAGGGIRLFTREGRQVAGPPLSAAEAAALFTEANGFLPGARLNTAGTNGTAGYRGLTLDRMIAAGRHVAALPLAQLASTPAGAPPAPWPGGPVTVAVAGRDPVSLTLPQGASAADAAAALRTALPGVGVAAETTAVMTAPGSGTLSFRIATGNGASVPITAEVAAGGMAGVAAAVNAATAATGVTAEVSPDGTRLMLRHATGADVVLSDAAFAGGPVSVAPADAQGFAGPAVPLGAGSLRIPGTLRLTGDGPMSLTLGGATAVSVQDAAAEGVVAVTSSAAGAIRRLDFRIDPALDAAQGAGDGVLPGGMSLSLTLGGRAVTIAGPGTPEAAAAMFARALREGMPTPTLTGAALSVPPPDGARMEVSLDGQTYAVTMTNGAPVVTGPEAGRLSASFDGSGRLVIAAAEGTTDGSLIRPVPGDPGAAAFGMGPGQAAATLTGAPVDPAALPPGGTTLRVRIGGTDHALTVTAAGGGLSIAVPPGFPGAAAVDPVTGRISLSLPAGSAAQVLPGGEGAGFPTLGAAVAVADGGLVLTATDGAPLSLAAGATALAAERLTLSNLPPEDLVVVMAGSDPLRLTGTLADPVPPPVPPAAELRVLDGATGTVALFDKATGDEIGRRILGAGGGSMTLGGYAITLGPGAATGDVWDIGPAGGDSGDGSVLDDMIALAAADPAAGAGGFAAILARMQGDNGARVIAATAATSAAEAARDSYERLFASEGAVNLDAEAARLIEQQQAYQASAQIITVAQALFDTLLNSM